MNFRKAALGLSIILGTVMGGVITYTSGTLLHSHIDQYMPFHTHPKR